MESTKPKMKFRQIFFCDMAIQEVNTGKFTLVGLFRSITAPAFPHNHSRMHIFFELTDVEKMPASIKLIIKNPDGKTIAESGGPFVSQDKVSNINVNFVLLGLPLEQPGDYLVEAMINNDVVSSSILPVLKSPTTS